MFKITLHQLERIGNWILTSFLPGCLPIVIRYFAFTIHQEPKKIKALDPVDLLSLGLALNIQTFHELSKGTVMLPRFARSLLSFAGILVTIAFSMLYFIYLLDKSYTNGIFVTENVFQYTLVLALISIFLNFITLMFSKS